MPDSSPYIISALIYIDITPYTITPYIYHRHHPIYIYISPHTQSPHIYVYHRHLVFRHLSHLTPEQGLEMTAMACEAVTASLVLTGLVHADPHEGNVMLGDDGSLVFLDFGLMSRVEPQIMEAFAFGIQSVISRDYDGLVEAFIATGFVGSPIMRR
tara:strand:- start:315 stop:782 length:468 start_codon:yes stop_codon:yes gene_type:complete